MTYKRHGRIGDSPIIGAGTWADDRTCAISATGWGEYFIRTAVAHDIHARILHGGMALQEAADQTIHDEMGALGGDGGIVGMSTKATCLFHGTRPACSGAPPSWRNTVSRPLRDGHRPSLNPFIEGTLQTVPALSVTGPPPTRHGRAQCGLEHLVVPE